jgi:two-component system KDP operon response regulator KdpE
VVSKAEPVIVLIEDDAAMRRLVRAALSRHGYRFFEAASGSDGLTEVATRHPDVVILDLRLPDMDGVEVIRRLREWTNVPVIVLSVPAAESDRVTAFEAGADDYITRPFGPDEFAARVRVALRHAARTGPVASNRFAVGDLVVDLARRQVFAGGRQVHLTPIEYRLLTALCREAGKVLTHRQLLTEVWGPSHATDAHYLRVYMVQLRRKLETDPVRPRYLLTEPGVGYRLASE